MSRWIASTAADDPTATEVLGAAIQHELLHVGEAARALSEEVRGAIDVPWHQIIGMRNILVHQYFDVDIELVWQTVEEDIPALENAIRRYLEDDVDGSS